MKSSGQSKVGLYNLRRKIMKKILSFTVILFLVIACKKQYPAKEGNVYIGRVYSNLNLYHYDFEREFTVHTSKQPTVYTFVNINDSSSIIIKVSYDKNTKELVGTFNNTYYDWYYPEISGKKIGHDIILTFDGLNGSIYLTPKN